MRHSPSVGLPSGRSRINTESIQFNQDHLATCRLRQLASGCNDTLIWPDRFRIVDDSRTRNWRPRRRIPVAPEAAGRGDRHEGADDVWQSTDRAATRPPSPLFRWPPPPPDDLSIDPEGAQPTSAAYYHPEFRHFRNWVFLLRTSLNTCYNWIRSIVRFSHSWNAPVKINQIHLLNNQSINHYIQTQTHIDVPSWNHNVDIINQ